jgi:hypothetical protein
MEIGDGRSTERFHSPPAPVPAWEHRLAEFNAKASFQDVKAALESAIAATLCLMVEIAKAEV